MGEGSLVSATLELYAETATNLSSEGRFVDIYRLATDWTEIGVTWNCPDDSNPGNSSPDCPTQWDGGSLAEDATDSILHTNGLLGPTPFDVTGDIEAFLDGTPNYGWLLKKNEEGQNGKVEYTSREGTPGQEPRLLLVVESATSDAVPPQLTIVAPNDEILVNDPTPAIVIDYSDGGTGVDQTSLHVEVDGSDITASCTTGPNFATCESTILAAGVHTIIAELQDQTGNLATAGASFELLLGAGPHVASLLSTADTYLRNGSPNQNQGVETFLRVRQSGKNRALVRFDQTELVTVVGDGTLISATLELSIEHNSNNWGQDGRTVDVHRLTTDWTELGVTWNCADDADPTNQQPNCSPQWDGGSFETQATDSVLHTKNLFGVVQFDVTTDVDAFLTGTPNNGWIVKKTVEGQSGRVEYTSREGTPGQEPRLVLVFETAVTDTDPPTLDITAPSEPIILNDETPAIVVDYADSDSGVDINTVQISVDSTDITASCAVGPSSATCESPILITGQHTISASVSDLAGNTATDSFSFELLLNAECLPGTTEACYDGPAETLNIGLCIGGTRTCDATGTFGTCQGQVLPQQEIFDNGIDEDCDGEDAVTPPDVTPPTIAITAPTDIVVDDNTPEIVVTYADTESGLDLASFQILINGIDITLACTVDVASATCETPPLPTGQHVVEASISDQEGNQADTSSGIILAATQIFAYITNTNDDTVVVLDTATDTVVATIDAGDVWGVVIHPDGTRVYVTDRVDNTLDVIDTGTNTVVGSIAVGAGARGVDLTPDGSKAYVTSNADDTISVIDTVTNTVIETITAGDQPYGLSMHPNGSRVYVVNRTDETLSIGILNETCKLIVRIGRR